MTTFKNIKPAAPSQPLKRVMAVALFAAAFALTAQLTPAQGAVPADFGLTEGDTIRAIGNHDVFIVNRHGYKRVVLNPSIFNFYGHLSFSRVKDVALTTRDAFPTWGLFRNCELNDPRVFALEITGPDIGKYHWLNMSSSQVLSEDPNFFTKVFCVNNLEFNWFTQADPYTSLNQIPPYSRGITPTSSPTTSPTTSPTPSPTTSPTASPTPAPNAVTISTASDNPASATIPKGASAVTFLKFNVTNTNPGAVTLSDVTVRRTGPGSVADFENVYIYQGANRLTAGRTINASSNEAVFTGLNLSISANTTVNLGVLADIDENASTGDVHALSITNATAANASVTGTASGNNMTIAGVSAGTVTIARSGVLTDPRIGDQNVEIAQFQLAAGTTEDIQVQRVTLTDAGSIGSGNLTNLVLRDRSTNAIVATSSGFDNQGRAVFGLSSPVTIQRGNTKTFSVEASISNSARSGDTIRIYLENEVDLFAIGQTFGFGANVDNSGYDNSANNGTDASWLIVNPGQFTVSFNGPASRDIAKNSQDVELFNFTLTSQVDVEVRQIKFNFDGGSGTADFIAAGNVPNYRDLKVIDTSTNIVVAGPLDFSGTDGGAGDTSQTLTFSNTIDLNAGQPRTFRLTTDVANNSDVTDGDTIRTTLDVSGFTNQIRNRNNNTFVSSSDIVPSSNVVGNTMTVRSASLALNLSSNSSSQTVVKGTQDVRFAGFVFTAGSASDVRVSSIRITCYIDASQTEADFVKGQDADTSGTVNCLETVPTVRLVVDGNQAGEVRSPGAGTDGTATFSSLNLTVPAGTSKVIEVRGNVSTSAFRNSDPERVSFDIDTASSDIAASDLSGNPITPTGNDPNNATSPTVIVTITETGSLTVAVAPVQTDVTDERIVLAGQNNVTLGQYRFTAQNEDIRLDKVRILLDSLDADVDISDNVTSLSLYDGDTIIAGPVSPTTVTAAGTVDAFADFNTISPSFVISRDSSKTLTVKGSLNTISGGADSGDEFRSALDFNDNFEARGTSSSTVITSVGSADVNGNYVVTRDGQPRLTLASLPSTVLTNGTQVIMKFDVNAVGSDVALKHLTFQAISSDATVALSNATVREAGVGTNITATTNITAVGGTNTIDVTFNSEQQIAAGVTKTYELRVDVSGAGASDTISTKVLGDTAIVTGELGPLAAAQQADDLDDVLNVGNDTDNDGAYNFIWSDMSAIPHNDTAGTVDDADQAGASNDWTNGRHIRILPTDSQTVVFPG